MTAPENVLYGMREVFTERARELRSQQTEAERKLWSRLRSRQLAGFKFRRQYAIGKYIVDFVCLERQLAIELDGGQHAEQLEYDHLRSEFLKAAGFDVLRFWNPTVFLETDGVLETILAALESPSPDGASAPSTSPPTGERLKN